MASWPRKSSPQLEATISFALTKLLSLLVYPLSQALLLCLLGLLLQLFGRGRSAFAAVGLAAAWLWLCSTALFADVLMGSLEKDFPPRALSATPAVDAIVVLGGATRGDTHMSSLGDLNQQADRLVHAAALYRAGKAPVVMVSGGSARGDRPEAQLMRDILQVMGVPRGSILLEESSRNTHDNAVNASALLKQRGAKRVLLVTSAFHMRRSMALFQGRGLEVTAAPTDYQRLVNSPSVPRWLPTADDLVRTTHALREYVGYWVYARRGWL